MSSLLKTFLPGVALTLAVVAAPARSDDTRLWQEGDVLMLEQAAWKGSVGWKLASEPSSTRLQSWELKPKLQWQWRPGLDSAVTYKFVHGRGGEQWSTTQALELDLIPSWRIGEHVKTQFTQRLGLVYPASGEFGYRYHLIPKIEWPAHWLPERLAIDTSLEGIYDLGNGRWRESKFSPLRLKIDAARTTWFIAYVLNHQRASPSSWRREHVLQLAVAFNVRRSSP